MENRRLITFLVFSFATVWLWGAVIAPRLFPPPKKPLQPAAETVAGKQEAANKPALAETAAETESAGTQKPAGIQSVESTDTPDVPTAADMASKPVVHPESMVTLGSQKPDSGFALEVQISSAGAAIESVVLTDPQFRELKNPDLQVRVIGNNSTRDRSFTSAVDLIDQQLMKFGDQTLETLHWKLDEQTDAADGMSVRFSYDAPDGAIRVEKTYRLARMKPAPGSSMPSFRDDPSGYTVDVDLKAVNLSDRQQVFTYELQGPVGVLLENDEHTSKYRDIKAEFLAGTKDITLTSQEIVKSCQKYEEEAGRLLNQTELHKKLSANDMWTGVFRYAGVDVQFFAALVAPRDNRSEEERIASRWIERTYPSLVARNPVDPRLSDISFRMVSVPITLEPRGGKDSVTHQYAFFVGPKRRELLDPLPLAASRVLDYGSWFGFVARGMHWLLDLFYGWGMPYVLAIISLTILVRGCMFPLSRKQAISAAKMKDLQPRLAELKVKFGDDREGKEKLARAQMELWRKHNINPLGGCVPLIFQLPVFVGLFTSLNTAIDLRQSRFLWIENLAAPDALFRLPVSLPFLGYDFSILPCITVALFLTQQKMFMPPAADEQQEAQQKMMNMMTVFFGFLFWHQPAGLCIYYIASSLWGIAERKLLGNTSVANSDGVDSGNDGSGAAASVLVTTPSPRNGGAGSSEAKKVPGFLQKLMDMAQEAKQNAEKNENRDNRNRKNKKSR